MPGLLQVAAVGPAGCQRRDRGHDLGQGAVGTDLVPLAAAIASTNFSSVSSAGP